MPRLAPGKDSPPPDQVYRGLRDQVLRTAPGDVGIAATPEAPRVWGVLLEIGMANGTATVVALADGTSSLYTSTGFGIIGGGFHERSAETARRCVREAEKAVEAVPSVDEVALPSAGRTALVLLTYEGPRRVEFASGPAPKTVEPIGTVLLRADDVLTELRALDR